MAIGFYVGGNVGTNGYAIPDKNLKRQNKPKVLKSAFGDGYEQRIKDGINSLEQTFSVAFNNRRDQEIDQIAQFLDGKEGVTAFNYTYADTTGTGGEITVKVVCDSYDVTYAYDDFSALTATLRRVYEP